MATDLELEAWYLNLVAPQQVFTSLKMSKHASSTLFSIDHILKTVHLLPKNISKLNLTRQETFANLHAAFVALCASQSVILWTALWNITGRGCSSLYTNGAKAFRVSLNGRWRKVWKANVKKSLFICLICERGMRIKGCQLEGEKRANAGTEREFEVNLLSW